MAISEFLVAFLLSASVPSVYGTEEGCLVEKNREVTNTTDTRILSLIKPDKHLMFKVQFEDHGPTFWRDWVDLTNSIVTHGKVRDTKNNQKTHVLPLVISEGWNTLHLMADGAHFKLTLLFGDDDEATLLNLELDFPVSSVHVEGTFSLCSGGSPEWEVAEGEVVSVPLQPKSSQMLQMIGRGDAAFYLVTPSSSSAPPKYISANTTLTIMTRRRGSVTQVEVFQNGKPLADMEQPLASPTVQIGCRAGTLYLRLDLFAPPDPSPPPATKKNSADSPCDWKALWPMGSVFCEEMDCPAALRRNYQLAVLQHQNDLIDLTLHQLQRNRRNAGIVMLFGCMVVGCLVGVTVAVLASRKMTRRATTSGAAAPLSACEEKFLSA